MPIYEYACEACSHELEALQSLSEAPLTECPACGRPALKKRISAVAFRLKGGGWYETDFKSGNRRNIAGDGKGESGKGAGDEKGGEKSTGTDAGGKSGAKAETSKSAAQGTKKAAEKTGST